MSPPLSLSDLLSISIVLRNIILYLPFSALCSLAQTCKAIRTNLQSSPDAYKYVDLSDTRLANCCPTIWNFIDCGRYGHRRCDCISKGNAQDAVDKPSDRDKNDTSWLTSRMKEPESREAFCSRPARSMLVHLGRAGILQYVQALILDNALITAEFIVNDVLIPTDEGRLAVRLLSIREATLTNGSKLAAMLKDYALTGSVASRVGKGLPRNQNEGDRSRRGIKGLYVFNQPITVHELRNSEYLKVEAESRERQNSVNGFGGEEFNSFSAKCTRNLWYEKSGFLLHGSIASYWADTLRVCTKETGALAFDAVICRGPRHDRDRIMRDIKLNYLTYRPPEIATAALGPRGCSDCGFAPEGFAYWRSQEISGADVPLLTPLPKARMTVREAKRPSPLPNPPVREDGEERRTLMRCGSCLARRYCSICYRWWCEFCYNPEDSCGHSTELIVARIMASKDSVSGARALTADAAFEIAMEEYIRGSKLVMNGKSDTYWCVEHCLKEKVFRPYFDRKQSPNDVT